MKEVAVDEILLLILSLNMTLVLKFDLEGRLRWAFHFIGQCNINGCLLVNILAGSHPHFSLHKLILCFSVKWISVISCIFCALMIIGMIKKKRQ